MDETSWKVEKQQVYVEAVKKLSRHRGLRWKPLTGWIMTGALFKPPSCNGDQIFAGIGNSFLARGWLSLYCRMLSLSLLVGVHIAS